MFQKKKNNLQNEQKAGSINIVGEGTEITGNLTTKGDIRIDGKIQGDVISQAKVVVGASGEVIGNIYAYSAELSGAVSGNITVGENLFLKMTAKVNGNILSNKLVIENGADFNGYCQTGVTDTNSIFNAKERSSGKEETTA